MAAWHVDKDRVDAIFQDGDITLDNLGECNNSRNEPLLTLPGCSGRQGLLLGWRTVRKGQTGEPGPHR